MLTIEQVKDKLALIEAAERIRAEVDSVSDDAPSNRTYWVFLEPGPYEAWKRGDDAKLSLSFRTTDLARLAISLSERLAAAEGREKEALPILEALMELRQITANIVQGSVERDLKLEARLSHAEDALLRVSRSPTRLRMLVERARLALAPEVAR